MEREYLIEGILVMIVLIVIAIIFLSFNTEMRQEIGDIINDVFGLTSEKDAQRKGWDSVELWQKSLEECTDPGMCSCVLQRGAMIEGYKLFAKNTAEGVYLLLYTDQNELIDKVEITGKKLTLMKMVSVKTNKERPKTYLVCESQETFELKTEDNFWYVTEFKDGSNLDYKIYGGPNIRGLFMVNDKELCLVTDKIETLVSKDLVSSELYLEFSGISTIKELIPLPIEQKPNVDYGDLKHPPLQRESFTDYDILAKNYLEKLEWCNSQS
ncbi:MAG: hypothetical protein ABH824_07090 [Nanoarchaeota archaeon]